MSFVNGIARTDVKKGLVSCVILGCLAFQAAIILGSQPREKGTYFWPFTDYPMYRVAYREGDSIDHYFLFGKLADKTEVAMEPEQMGLNRYTFRRGPVKALLTDNLTETRFYARFYEDRERKKLMGLRLEKQSWKVSKNGPVLHSVDIVREVEFGSGPGS